jgi:hypothetical protein
MLRVLSFNQAYSIYADTSTRQSSYWKNFCCQWTPIHTLKYNCFEMTNARAEMIAAQVQVQGYDDMLVCHKRKPTWPKSSFHCSRVACLFFSSHQCAPTFSSLFSFILLQRLIIFIGSFLGLLPEMNIIHGIRVLVFIVCLCIYEEIRPNKV